MKPEKKPWKGESQRKIFAHSLGWSCAGRRQRHPSALLGAKEKKQKLMQKRVEKRGKSYKGTLRKRCLERTRPWGKIAQPAGGGVTKREVQAAGWRTAMTKESQGKTFELKKKERRRGGGEEKKKQKCFYTLNRGEKGKGQLFVQGELKPKSAKKGRQGKVTS